MLVFPSLQKDKKKKINSQLLHGIILSLKAIGLEGGKKEYSHDAELN